MADDSRAAEAEGAARRAAEAEAAYAEAEAALADAVERVRASYAARIHEARARASVATRYAIAQASDPAEAARRASACRDFAAKRAARAFSRGVDSLQKTPPDLPNAAWRAVQALRELRKAAKGTRDFLRVRHYCHEASCPDPPPLRTKADGRVVLD